MRPIKFRGRLLDGHVVYGSYYYENFSDIGEVHYIVDEHGGEYVIAPDSVAQLVGYDKNRREVYDNDTLIDRDGRRVKARLRPNFTSIAVLKETDQ